MSSNKTSKPQNPSGKNPSETPTLVVIGSINMDLVVRTAVIPKPGETVTGYELQTFPGGKGANQAVAAARCGGQVSFIGQLGRDDFGRQLLEGLRNDQIDVAAVGRCSDTGTAGTAVVLLDDQSRNAICVIPGSNSSVNTEQIDAHRDLIAQADAVIMQMEIPLPVVSHTLKVAGELDIPVILNPSPIPATLEPEIFLAKVLIVNEHEAAQLAQIAVTDVPSAHQAGKKLREMGPEIVIITLGNQGAVLESSQHSEFQPALPIKAVDSTGAGDSFCGAFSVSYATGMAPPDALRFAMAAGALACTKLGAQPSMPTRNDVIRLLEANR